jgi:hypothetical protein
VRVADVLPPRNRRPTPTRSRWPIPSASEAARPRPCRSSCSRTAPDEPRPSDPSFPVTCCRARASGLPSEQRVAGSSLPGGAVTAVAVRIANGCLIRKVKALAPLAKRWAVPALLLALGLANDLDRPLPGGGDLKLELAGFADEGSPFCSIACLDDLAPGDSAFVQQLDRERLSRRFPPNLPIRLRSEYVRGLVTNSGQLFYGAHPGRGGRRSGLRGGRTLRHRPAITVVRPPRPDQGSHCGSYDNEHQPDPDDRTQTAPARISVVNSHRRRLSGLGTG